MEVDEGHNLPPLMVVKEEKSEFDEDLDKTREMLPRPRGRTRSLTKRPTDKADIKAKLERSRQSARECRARKKLRYQYLEEIISESEKAIFKLRKELDTLKIWAKELDEGRLPDNLLSYKQSCESGQMSGCTNINSRMDQKFYLQEQSQTAQTQIQQPLGISPSNLGATSMSPLASGLSLSPNTSNLNAYFALAASTGSNPLLSSSLSPP